MNIKKKMSVAFGIMAIGGAFLINQQLNSLHIFGISEGMLLEEASRPSEEQRPYLLKDLENTADITRATKILTKLFMIAGLAGAFGLGGCLLPFNEAEAKDSSNSEPPVSI